MIIDISFEKERSVQELIDGTIKYCGLEGITRSDRYICVCSILFSITPGFIHITSILDTEEQVKFLENYIQCLFKGSVIGICCFKFIERFVNIPDVKIFNITPKLCSITDE